jgi:hypothetical protein
MTANLVTGIRNFADMVEQMPYDLSKMVYVYPTIYLSVDGARKLMAQFPGDWNKNRHQNRIIYTKKFADGFTLYLETANPTCERVKVGEKVIPAVPEHTEDVYEWQCPDAPSNNSE